MKFTSNMIGNCRLGSGFVKSSNYLVTLRCIRAKNGYIITGFNSISASTTLTAYFYLKSLVAVTSSAVSIDIFGIYRDNSTRIALSNISTITHPNGSYSTTLYRIPEMTRNYYTSFNGQYYYYEFEGSLTLRAQNLLNSGMSIFITDPYVMYGDRRLTIKKNTSTVTGWTELTDGGCTGSTRCRYYLPNNVNNTLTLELGAQYIWRYTS